jgi:hypothetical protein
VRIVFDQGTPAPLRSHLSAHQVSTAFELNWGTLKNGDLLSKAEQNLSKRRIAIVVIGTTSWPRIKKGVAAVVDAVNGIELGGYVEVPIP